MCLWAAQLLLLNMCNILELSGLFCAWRGLVKFVSVWGGTKKIAGLWFLLGRISSQTDTMKYIVVRHTSPVN